MQPTNWRGKIKVRGEQTPYLCIYRCVPPTHEYGTRPFLRWARSQGRSPHASGKAKNSFGPVGIPLFGAPQAPGNKPNLPEGGISLGGWPPEAGGTLQCRGTPGRTAQRWDGLPNATQELERKGHKHLWIFAAWSLFYMEEREFHFCRATWIESSSTKNGRRK